MRYIKTIAGVILIAVTTVIACVGSYKSHRHSIEYRPASECHEVVEIYRPIDYIEIAPVIEYEPSKIEGEKFVPVDVPLLRESTFVNLTFEEQELLEEIAMAEAKGEGSVGMALVMCTVLNRSLNGGSSIRSVIYSPSQFYTVGMCAGSDACHEALAMVMDGWNETQIEGDWDHSMKILWFSADGYPAYGEPMFQYGGHYFSGIAF